MFRRNVAALFCLLLCAGSLPARFVFAQAAAPLLITEEGTDTAVAVEPVTRARDPFPVTQALAFSADAPTRPSRAARTARVTATSSSSTATTGSSTSSTAPFPTARAGTPRAAPSSTSIQMP